MRYFKNINYSSAFKRLLILFIPIFLMPFGIACYYACGLGADPFSIFVDGEHVITGLTYGEVTTINNTILLTLMVFFGRKYINIGTIITSFTTGPLIDASLDLILLYFPSATTPLIMRAMILLIGCVAFAVGVGVYISVSLGIGPVEFISLFIVDRTNISLKYVRIALDALFTILGYLMGGVVGIGTILGVLATGPIIEYTLKLAEEPVNRFAGPMHLR